MPTTPTSKAWGRRLDQTRLYADRCFYLLEEARFLLGKINPKELRKGGTSLCTLVREILGSLQPYAATREVEFVFSPPSEIDDTASIDHLLITIAVFNLIDNAVKYSHRKQKVRLRLRLTKEMWRLDVEDTGVHIPREFHNVMYQPFVRRPAGSIGHNRPGTGLGLAVVKQVADAHGGHIDFWSKPLDPNQPEKGAFTTFSLSIPRR